jgi:type I restriction enzyme S subunit
MSNWKTVELQSVCEIISGGTPSREESKFWNGDINWVTPTDITSNKAKFLSHTKETITKDGLKSSSARLLPMGTILLTSRASIGFASIAKIACCTNQGFKNLICKHEVDNEYMYYYVDHSLKRQMEVLACGSTFLEITKKDMSRLKVKIPTDFKEQKDISRILSTADYCIQKTEETISKLQKIKSGLMQDLFTRGVDEHGKLRPTFNERPEIYKDSPLGKIPSDWAYDSFSNLTQFISYGFTNPMPETNDGPHMITAKDVRDGAVDYEQCRKTSFKAFNELLTKKSKPQVGDILLTKDGTLGRLAVVEQEGTCINQSVAIIRPSEKLEAVFLKTLLETEQYQHIMLADAGGSTIKHLYITTIDKMIIKYPKNKIERTRLLKTLMAIDENLEFEKGGLKKLQTLKQGLMQDLFTGKVKVKEDK